MDLDQMKNTWAELSNGLSQKAKVHDRQILELIQRKSSSSLNRIVYLELLGIVVTLVMLGYLLINFHKLDNWLTIGGGIILVVILAISLFMGSNIILQIRKVDVLNNSYQQALTNFGKLKRLLKLYKKLGIALNILMPFIILPVVSQLFFGKNLLNDLAEFGEGLIVSFLLIPLVLYLLITYYKKLISKAKSALDSLNK